LLKFQRCGKHPDILFRPLRRDFTSGEVSTPVKLQTGRELIAEISDSLKAREIVRARNKVVPIGRTKAKGR
jgi:hypothetical protein